MSEQRHDRRKAHDQGDYGYLRVCEDIPFSFPPQHQTRQPGLEYLMQPPPRWRGRASGQRLAGRVALITGGDSGIGRAAAYAFVREGARVALAFYNEEEDARETEAQIRKLGGSCLLLQGDLKDRAFAGHCVEQTLEAFGQLHVLINNHAVQYVQRDIRDISPEQLQLVFQTNVLSFFYLIQAALPYLKRGSSIINTTSVTAYQGNRDLIDYSATKGAIVALTRSLALSLAERGIRVNGVAPGPIWTPLIPASYTAQEVATFGRETAQVPMMRAGQPEEVAPCYVFLASEEASYMTGQILHPNGGVIVGA